MDKAASGIEVELAVHDNPTQNPKANLCHAYPHAAITHNATLTEGQNVNCYHLIKIVDQLCNLPVDLCSE